jgi:hypothetical protein
MIIEREGRAQLIRIGYDDLRGYLDGGSRLGQRRLPIQRVPIVPAENAPRQARHRLS